MNEDSAYASNRLVAVADGMGGCAGGDIASSIVIECLARMDRSRDRILFADLRDAANKANQKFRSVVDRDPELAGLGTTMTAISIEGKQITLAHIGDSRAYIFRDGRLIQLTVDHTYVQLLVEEGRLSPAEAATHPDRNALVRVLNGNRSARPDVSVHNILPTDRFLLCSDGLSGVVPPAEIEQLLTLQPAQAAVRQLIERARQYGGPDNITCVVSDTVDSGRAKFDPSSVITLGAVATEQ